MFCSALHHGLVSKVGVRFCQSSEADKMSTCLLQHIKAIEGALVTEHQHSFWAIVETKSTIFHRDCRTRSSSNDEDSNTCLFPSPPSASESLYRRHDLRRNRYVFTHQHHPPLPLLPSLPTLTLPGLGSYDSNAIVALSTEILANGANPNNNPKCGTLINIYNPATRKTHSATIVDTCKGCSTYDIDVSPSVFEAVDPNGLGDGRITVDWGGSAVGEKKMRMMARGEAA